MIFALLYHKIKDPEEKSTLCVSKEDFFKQMDYLYKEGYRSLTVDEFLQIYRDKSNVSSKDFLITFDDGYENFLSILSILKEFKFKATLFLVSGLVGKTNIWDEREGRQTEILLSWEQIQKILEEGIVEFGSHSLSHCCLTKIRWYPKLFKEIRNSKIQIERNINCKIKFFSYPYGRTNRIIKMFLRFLGYKAAFISDYSSKISKNIDLYAIPRIEINTPRSNIKEFVKVIKEYEKL